MEALQREARLASSLDHPNITRVHDFQVEGDTAYIVMDYVPDSLDKHTRAGQPLPYQRAVQIACIQGDVQPVPPQMFETVDKCTFLVRQQVDSK